MDLKYGGDEAKKFITNVGLVSSSGSIGDNIMSAEWTHVISYSPWLIMINIGEDSASAKNIIHSKEFGVSIASNKQANLSSISGRVSGNKVNKISMLKEVGITFYKAKKINAMMPNGAALNLECKVVKHEKVGNKVMVIGEVVESSVDKNATPLIFSSGEYKSVSEFTQSDPRIEQKNIEELAAKHLKT